MFKTSLAEIEAQQLRQIFAMLDSCGPGITLEFFKDSDGRCHVRIRQYDTTTDKTDEQTVSGSSARDAFAQAAMVLP